MVATLLKRSECIDGEIYKYNGNHICIFPNGANLSGDRFTTENIWCWNLDITIPSEEEKEHLRACIRAKGYVTLEQSKPIKNMELKEGEIYKCIYHSSSRNDHIFKATKDLHGCSHISDGSVLCYESGTFKGQESHCTIASQEEKDWLNACIAAKKFVPLKKFPEIGDWVYVINKGSSILEKGKVYKVNAVNSSTSANVHCDIDGKDTKNNRCWLANSEYRKALDSEIPKDNEMESLLKKAKTDFPIGTKFSNHFGANGLIIVGECFISSSEKNIYANAPHASTIYDGGIKKWAVKEESNLEKAKRLYPKGTKFKAPNLSGVYVSTGEIRYINEDRTLCVTECNNNPYCHMGSVWAEIITGESDLEKAIRLYPIGTKYMGIYTNGETREDVVKRTPYESGDDDIEAGYAFLYIKKLDKWAEIITSVVKKEAEPEYYKCITPTCWGLTVKANGGFHIFRASDKCYAGYTIEKASKDYGGNFVPSTKAEYEAERASNATEWSVGGWVEILEEYYDCKKGYIFQIVSIPSENNCSMIEGIFTNKGKQPIFKSRCKWLGMTKPFELLGKEPLSEDSINSFRVNSGCQVMPGPLSKKGFDEAAYNAKNQKIDIKINKRTKKQPTTTKVL